MTEYVESEQERKNLYNEYQAEIESVRTAFEYHWRDFSESWGARLAENLDFADIVEIPSLPDRDIAVDVELEDDTIERWFFNHHDEDWAGLIKEGWWIGPEARESTYKIQEDDIRITLYHRLQDDLDFILQEKKIRLSVTQGIGNTRKFQYDFADRIKQSFEKNCSMYPETVEKRDNKLASPLRVTYDIPVESYETFLKAYVAALTKAFTDLLFSNRRFIDDIDRSFNESILELDDADL